MGPVTELRYPVIIAKTHLIDTFPAYITTYYYLTPSSVREYAAATHIRRPQVVQTFSTTSLIPGTRGTSHSTDQTAATVGHRRRRWSPETGEKTNSKNTTTSAAHNPAAQG